MSFVHIIHRYKCKVTCRLMCGSALCGTQDMQSGVIISGRETDLVGVKAENVRLAAKTKKSLIICVAIATRRTFDLTTSQDKTIPRRRCRRVDARL